MEEDYGVPNALAVDTGTPLMQRRFSRPWQSRPRFDAPGRPSAIAEDTQFGDARGGSATGAVTGPGFGSGLRQGLGIPERGPIADFVGGIGQGLGISNGGARGGKPERLGVPPPPPDSTGTKYPDHRPEIAEMARPENDAVRQAAHKAINAGHTTPASAPKSTLGVPGVLNYSIGGGPMRSRAPGQGGPAGEDFSATQGSGFGKTWKPGGGGYMQSDINSLPYEQRPESYKAVNMSPAEYKLSPAGMAEQRSTLEHDNEVARRRDYQASVSKLNEQAQQVIQAAKATKQPAEAAKIEAETVADLEDRIKAVDKSFDLGARFRSNPDRGI